MLILTRKPGERIVINGNVVVTVLEILNARGDRIKLGIDAPREVSVHRGEVFDAIRRNGEYIGE